MTSADKIIVCLANSRKLSGRCIAGLEVAKDHSGNWVRSGRWIRPVSNRDREEVSEREREYEDGSDPRLLDIISVPMIQAKPNGYQSENWLIDPDYYWQKIDRMKRQDLVNLLDVGNDLWDNQKSTQKGRHDEMDLATASQFTHSLRLVRLSEMVISVVPRAYYGTSKRRVQARFQFNGQDYWLWVTDPDYEREYLKKEDGDYKIDKECYVTVSLGEPFKGHCYKLVAAIIEH